MSKIVLGVDVGGTKVEMAKVDVKKEEIVSEIYSYKTEDFKTNDSLLNAITSYWPKELPLGICAPGVPVGMTVDCRNISFKKLDFSQLINYSKEIYIDNDLGGASYVLDSRMEKEGVKKYSLWTISTGGNGHTVYNGQHINHELGHQEYTPTGIKIPFRFKMPACGCKSGKEGETHLEVGFSAGGAEKMAKEYYLENNCRFGSRNILQKALDKYNLLESSNLEMFALFHNKNLTPRILDKIGAGMIYEAYRENKDIDPQGFIVPIQIQSLSRTIGNYLAHFPGVERIYIMGSQGIKNFEDQVIPAAKEAREKEMYHPAINFPNIRKLEVRHPGIIGSAIAYIRNAERIKN